MQRRHTPKEENLLKKWKRLIERISPNFPFSISRKKHPLSCSKPGCSICHPHKQNGHESTKQETSAELKLREQMNDEEHADFHIGLEFFTANNVNYRWRVTDVGTRTIAAILLEHDDDPSWYNGPPYAVAESIFDENDFGGCSTDPADDDPEGNQLIKELLLKKELELETAKERIVRAFELGNVKFAPGLEDSIRSMSRTNADFTITSTALAHTWGKPPEVTGAFDDPPPCSTEPGGFEVHWRTVSAGGGCVTFYMNDGKLCCDNETMSSDFVKAVMSHLVDQAKFDD